MVKMKLPSRQQTMSFLSNLTEKGIVLAIIVYIVFSVGRSVMKNYEMNRKIDDLKMKIEALQQEQAFLRSLIAYYKTDTFKELKAREELGFQKPGEHVLSVPVEEDDRPIAEQGSFIAAEPVEVKPAPNYQKWFNYFFEL